MAIPLPGIIVTRTPLGGKAVWRGEKLIGWVHQRDGKWNAYRRTGTNTPGYQLGVYPEESAAVLAVVEGVHETG